MVLGSSIMGLEMILDISFKSSKMILITLFIKGQNIAQRMHSSQKKMHTN